MGNCVTSRACTSHTGGWHSCSRFCLALLWRVWFALVGGGLVLDDCLVFTCGGWVLAEASFVCISGQGTDA